MAHERRSVFPIVLAVGSLILLLLFLGMYLENCLRDRDVLGVSNFSSSASKNPVLNGEAFSFTSTIVGDQSGLLNATALFRLSGKGVIGSNIQGPGVCTKVNDSTAACNNADVDPNETVNWIIPVTASSDCSPSSISLQTQLVATLVSSTTTASVDCVTSQATPAPTGSGSNPTPTTTNTGGNVQPSTAPVGGQNSGTTNTNTTNTTRTTGGSSSSQKLPGTQLNVADFACYRVNGFPLVLLLIIVWLIVNIYYFVFHRHVGES